MEKRKKIGLTVLCSALAVLACGGGLAVATYALFNDRTETENHLQAGNLDAELWLMQSEELVYDSKSGTMVEKSDDTPVNISDVTLAEKSLFDIQGFLPGSYRQVDLQLRNVGDLAFTYSIDFVNVVAEGENSKALLQQIQVTYTNGEDSVSFPLAEKEFAVTTPVVGSQNADFSIKAEFLSGDNNNIAMGGSVSFDIVVEATQVLPE